MEGSKQYEDDFISKVASLGGRRGGDCVLTVESLLVHDGAAAQGLVVLLVAHERVHAQDSCGDTEGPMTRPSQTEGPPGHGHSTPSKFLLPEMARNSCMKTFKCYLPLFT